MPNGTVCQLVKLPIVVGELVASVTVDNVTCLEEQAKKVDHIDVVVRDLEADPVYTAPTNQGVCNSPKATVHFGDPDCNNLPREIRQINVHGTLHKQIYYVNRDDDVRHMGEDIDFTKTISLHPPLIVMEPQNVEIDFRNVDVNVSFDLPRHNKIHQVADITFTLKIVEHTQMYVSIYPNGCEPTATLGIQDSFEEWIGNSPAVWDGENVAPHPDGRTGEAAALCACPTLPAYLSRSIPDVVAGVTYEVSYWAKLYEMPVDPCAFDLTSQVQFLDSEGNVLNTTEQTITSEQLSLDDYRQFRYNATAPEGTASALLGFVCNPESWNTCSALVDDVSFLPTGQ